MKGFYIRSLTLVDEEETFWPGASEQDTVFSIPLARSCKNEEIMPMHVHSGFEQLEVMKIFEWVATMDIKMSLY